MKESLVSSYAALKAQYFCLLRSKKVAKGDIRAFVGLKTWMYEEKELSLGSEPRAAHVSAFSKAISDLKAALRDGVLAEAIKNALPKWCDGPQSLPRKSGGDPLLPPPIATIDQWEPNGFTVVSLFTGAFGLDLGFLAAGFNLSFANDVDGLCQEVASENIPSVPFLLADFAEVSASEVLRLAGLCRGQIDVLVGGPPCQPFSTAGRRQGLNDPRSSPLKAFVRAIKELAPRAFVMEEVTGLKSARLRHIPISERGIGPLPPDGQKGSAFAVVLEMLASTGYCFLYRKLNAADYGAPQSRERLIFIGLRDGMPSFPTPTHAMVPGSGLFNSTQMPWNTLWEATADIPVEEANYMPLSNTRSSYMELVPPGGHWRQLPRELVPEAMGGAYHAGGGKMGFYRRLSWDEPSPTVVTSPTQKGTMFCHPEQLRPLSLREYKRVQGFPDDWHIPGSLASGYRLVGNAVPVHLSYAIARNIASMLRGKRGQK